MKTILKGVLIGVLGFLFGLFTSATKKPFLSLLVIFLVSLVLFIRNYKTRIHPPHFWILSLGSLVIGFTLGILDILPSGILTTGPNSALIIVFGTIFVISTFFIFSLPKHPSYYFIGYFLGAVFLFMGILSFFGTIKDYTNDNLNYPLNIIGPTILVLLWIFAFISFYIAFKTHQKIKKMRKK